VCQPTVVTADLSQVAIGASVEGMGVAAPGLNIDAAGTAVKIVEGQAPLAYGAGTGNSVINGGVEPNGAFVDMEARLAAQPQLMTFTFSPGTTVSQFSVHMLDFGDYNPLHSTNVYASMTAYDANGSVVGIRELSYTWNAAISPEYGDLAITGDALLASPGDIGNWTWVVTGSGIVKVVLEFGTGYDPNIAFDVLTFTPECSTTTSLMSSQLGYRYMPSGQHLR